MDSTSPSASAASARNPPLNSWRLWYPREIVAPWLISRLALILVAWLAMYLLQHMPRPGAWEIGAAGQVEPIPGAVSLRNPLVNMWSRWDAGWYHNVAEHGYNFSPDKPSNVAFFPVYPMLLRATHAVVHSRKAIWWLVCGIIVSNAALLGCLIYLFLLARLEFDEETARRAVLYLLIFPTTLFLSAVYSESVFLL
ncbi:MAG: mannosyltransferase family protein, partial [Chthoniobacterales bacterium]